MDSFDIDRYVRFVAELRQSWFELCTRCGGGVAAYHCHQFLDHDESRHSDERLPGGAESPPEDCVYWCPACGTRWRAFGAGDTGWFFPCGHFMPFYVDYCAVCGLPEGDGTQPSTPNPME